MRTSHLACWTALSLLVACGEDDDGSTFGGGGSSATQDPNITDEDDGADDTAGGEDGGGDDGSSGSGSGGSGGSGGDDGDDTGVVIVGTGYSEGDTAYDLVGKDGGGAEWHLHDRYGTQVVLVVGNAYDQQVVDMLEYLGSVGAYTVFFARFDEQSSVADVADAANWESTYGMDAAVVQTTGNDFTTWGTASPPRLYVIDDEMVITWVNSGFTPKSQLEGKL